MYLHVRTVYLGGLWLGSFLHYSCILENVAGLSYCGKNSIDRAAKMKKRRGKKEWHLFDGCYILSHA